MAAVSLAGEAVCCLLCFPAHHGGKKSESLLLEVQIVLKVPGICIWYVGMLCVMPLSDSSCRGRHTATRNSAAEWQLRNSEQLQQGTGQQEQDLDGGNHRGTTAFLLHSHLLLALRYDRITSLLNYLATGLFGYRTTAPSMVMICWIFERLHTVNTKSKYIIIESTVLDYWAT